MFGKLLISLSILIFAVGCATRPSRKGVLSEELPLTLGDLAEIKAGDENHQKILEEYKVYPSPKLETYLNAIAASVAEVSSRPHLPYKVVILDSDEVNIFGGPGGYIYMTRGLFNFMEAESELAGVIAHEIGHISAYEYAGIPQHQRIKFVYQNLLRGSELASETIGSYGTAVNKGLKAAGKAAPHIAKRFTNDQEVIADEKAVQYLLKAGYDPRGMEKFLQRLARVEMGDVNRFVEMMNTHPPFQARRDLLVGQVKKVDYASGKIEFKKDLLSEVRQTSLNAPTSVIFEPELGVHHAAAFENDQMNKDKDDGKFSSLKKRWGWF